jgi:hypothetical protein
MQGNPKHIGSKKGGYPLVLHVDLRDLERNEVNDDQMLGHYAFKKLVLTAELRPAK